MILCPGAEILMSFLFNRWPSSTRAHPCLCSHSLSPRQAPTTTTPPSRSSPSSPSCTCASVPITPYLSEFSVLIQQLYLKINLLITLFSLKSYSTGYCKYSFFFYNFLIYSECECWTTTTSPPTIRVTSTRSFSLEHYSPGKACVKTTKIFNQCFEKRQALAKLIFISDKRTDGLKGL